MTGGTPLEGVCAIVLTHAWAGTFATELLALSGAEVIQIEARRRPDGWRMGLPGDDAGRTALRRDRKARVEL